MTASRNRDVLIGGVVLVIVFILWSAYSGLQDRISDLERRVERDHHATSEMQREFCYTRSVLEEVTNRDLQRSDSFVCPD